MSKTPPCLQVCSYSSFPEDTKWHHHPFNWTHQKLRSQSWQLPVLHLECPMSKSYWFHCSNISQISTSPWISTIITFALALIISHLNYCNSFLDHPPTKMGPGCPQSLFYPEAIILFSKCSFDMLAPTYNPPVIPTVLMINTKWAWQKRGKVESHPVPDLSLRAPLQPAWSILCSLLPQNLCTCWSPC